jgi:hypothetical protein
MNATLIRNILSLTILGMVLVTGFQLTTPREALAAPFSCGGPNYPACQNCCQGEFADCNDACQDAFLDCHSAAQEELETCEECQGEEYREEHVFECFEYSGAENCQLRYWIDIQSCYDDRDECTVDCDAEYDDCLGGCTIPQP